MTKEELENIDDIDMLYDLLNKAYCAETDKWKIKYANKVLEMNKENPSIIKLLSYGFLEDYLDDGIEIGGYIGETANEAAEGAWHTSYYIGGGRQCSYYQRIFWCCDRYHGWGCYRRVW